MTTLLFAGAALILTAGYLVGYLACLVDRAECDFRDPLGKQR